MKDLDRALDELPPEEIAEYEEAIELWITYGGDQRYQMKFLMYSLFIFACSISVSESAMKVSQDLSEAARDAKALELYLQDKQDHKDCCPELTWEQPLLSKYKETLKSQLPEGCKK